MHKPAWYVKSALLVAVAVASFTLLPKASRANTITQTFNVTVPSSNNIVFITNLTKFDPANGTLFLIRMSLTGSFDWFATTPTPPNPPVPLAVDLDGQQGFAVSQNFFAVQTGAIPNLITVNLFQFTSSPNIFSLYTGTIGNPLITVGFVAFPTDIFLPAPGGPLTGTLDYDYIPTAAVAEPSTWAMMLLGFAGLGFAFRRTRRKTAFDRPADRNRRFSAGARCPPC
jgi:hypothetical protein